MKTPPKTLHSKPLRFRVGTAGWSILGALADRFPQPGSHLERYSRVLDCAEINSSFHRPHRTSTYERWAASTPPGFRFSAKLPRDITHVRRLEGVGEPLDAFFGQVAGLGDKLGLVLLQLPPSFKFDDVTVGRFLELLRRRHAGAVGCEPREAGWFTDEAQAFLERFRVCRIAADPPVVPQAAVPGGWMPKTRGRDAPSRYFRWHGSPRIYWSSYDDDWLAARAKEVDRGREDGECWCVFDNTASGAALANALVLQEKLRSTD